LALPYQQRQLQYCDCLFSHRIFNELMHRFFRTGSIPSLPEIIQTLQAAKLGIARATIERRAKTVYSWLAWVAGLVQANVNFV